MHRKGGQLRILGAIMLLASLLIPIQQTLAQQQPVFAFPGAQMTLHATMSMNPSGVYASSFNFNPISTDYTMKVLSAGATSAQIVYSANGQSSDTYQIVYTQPSPALDNGQIHLPIGGLDLFLGGTPTPSQNVNPDIQKMRQLQYATAFLVLLPDYVPPADMPSQLRSIVDYDIRNPLRQLPSDITQNLVYSVKTSDATLQVSSLTLGVTVLNTTITIIGQNFQATEVLLGYYHANSGLLLKSDRTSNVQYQSSGGSTSVITRMGGVLTQTNIPLQSATITQTATTTTVTTSIVSTGPPGTAQVIMQGIAIRKVGDVVFRTDILKLPDSASNTASGIRVDIPLTSTTLFANDLKIGSLAFGLAGTILKANGGEKDTLSGDTAKQGDYLMRGSAVIGVQIDSLPAWQVNNTFALDISSRVANFVVDKVQDAVQQAISAGGEALIVTLNPQLLCGIVPVPAVVGNTPCGGSLVVVAASPVNLLVISPSGRMIGTTANGTQVNQLSGAWYSGKSVEPQIVWITQPEQGKYNATMTGTGTGSVGYAIASFTSAGALVNSFNSTVSQGQVLTSSISLSGGSLDVKPPALISSQNVGQQTSLSVPIELIIPIAVGIIVVVGLFFGIRSRRKTSAA